MGLSFSARRRSCWLLLIAFLYASLVPALGLASGKSAVARTVWVQFCNSATHEFVAIDLTDGQSSEGDKPSASRATGHCLLCHSPSLLPTTETPHVAVVLVRYLRLVVADDPAPRAAPVWNVSLARAPPVAA
ncbi:Protein of uncharacterised function (DUF2946) [Bordetella ansorpii]|uniref:Protein of uncharacterized function (DUF2946) n=1 Tax=Bordetella ansorpii TaxID=288768 RepID=A0A157SV47_9BORD|nr:DUF2946 family protein [Bordetella ansorpii]SAI73796.1 Protein of uncharacterised function (DUF2946) [Bordetella ansorpii]